MRILNLCFFTIQPGQNFFSVSIPSDPIVVGVAGVVVSSSRPGHHCGQNKEKGINTSTHERMYVIPIHTNGEEE